MLQPCNRELAATQEGEWAEVCVPKVWIHEIVVAEWAEA
jgi:hypothetical protein